VLPLVELLVHRKVLVDQPQQINQVPAAPQPLAVGIKPGHVLLRWQGAAVSEICCE
jgi:hypothetical protein